MKDLDKLKILYRKYLSREVTSEEYDQLFDALKDIRNLKALKEEMGDEWEKLDEERSPVAWMDIEEAYLNNRGKKGGFDTNWKWGIGIAASISIIIVALMWKGRSGDDFLVYETGFAEVEEIVLDDGSVITLNANSKLEWAKDWKDNNRRKVFLSGEAFFDVVSIYEGNDTTKTPFIVETHDLSIRVVGTAFNVKSRGDQTDVYLDEGSVELGLHERTDTSVFMIPGQLLSYSVATTQLVEGNGNIDQSASWKDGSFQYTSKKLDYILTSIEDIYGKEFEITDMDLLNRKYSAVFPYSDWEVVKKSIELLTGVDLEEKQGIIKIKK
ncbi:FecR family protein [Membranihabitans maritimus]|uniref:FecR family protein n=1 Tax=Membranihabitans maritimus TaxID=2904244 RepID=UPI001F24CD79|nr:FecR domain-containing protein [Membranihabitans maritimus]